MRYDAVLSALITAKGIEQTTRKVERYEDDLDKAAEAATRAEKATDKLGRNRSLRSLDRDSNALSKRLGGVGDRLMRFDRNLNMVGRGVTRFLKPAAVIAFFGLFAQGASAATAGVVALLAALTPAAGALAAYPALLSAGAQAAGAWSLAMKGASAATVKLSAKLEKPTGAVKRLRDHLNRFIPDLRELQRTVQRPIFLALERGLDRVSGLLPKLRSGLAKTSAAIAGVIDRASALVSTRSFGRDFERQMDRNAGTISRLGRAGIYLADAVRHVTLAAGPLVNWLTRSAVKLAELVRNAAEAGRESGRMAEFFEQTRAVLSRVASIAGAVGRALWNIAKAGAPLGNELLAAIDANAKSFADWTESARGENAIVRFFERARGPIFEVGRLISDLTSMFFRLGQGPGVTRLLRQFRTELLPVIEDVIRSTTRAFGPALIETLTAVGRLFGAIAGSSGPLVLFVELVGKIAGALADILESNSGLKTMLTTFLGIKGALMAIKFGAMITGLTTVAKLGGPLGGKFGRAFGGAAGPIAAGLIVSALAGIKFGQTGVLSQVRSSAGFLAEELEITLHKAERLMAFMKANPGLGAPESLAAMSQARKQHLEPLQLGFDRVGKHSRLNSEDLSRWATRAGASFGKARSTALPQLRGLSADMDTQTRRGGQAMGDNVQRASRRVTAEFGTMDRQSRASSVDLWVGVGRSFGGLGGTIFDALSVIKDNVNMSLGKFGANPLKYVLKKIGNALGIGGHQRGGIVAAQKGAMVPGVASGDRHLLSLNGVPIANVESGEKIAVVNREAAKREMALNAAVPRFRVGGEVGGLQPGAAQLAAVLSNRFGQTVSSGLRPGDDGYHGRGLAIDTTGGDWRGASRYVNSIGPSLLEGIYNPADFGGSAVSWDSGSQVPSSFWGGEWSNHLDHIHSALSKLGAAGAGVAKEIARVILKGPAGPMLDLGQGALDTSWAAAKEFVASKMPAMVSHGNMGVSTAGLGSGQAANRKLGRKMMLKRFGADQWPYLDHLWGVDEGTWDENLANLAGSGAYGIAQALPSSKYPPAGQPSAPPGIKKAGAQIGWGLGYIGERYGTPAAADAFRHQAGWYREGGIVQKLAKGGWANLVGGGGGGGGGGGNYAGPWAGTAPAGGGGGGSPSTPDWNQLIPDVGGGGSGFDIGAALHSPEKLHRLLDKIKGVGLPPEMQAELTALAEQSDRAEEMASRASSLTIDPITEDGAPILGQVEGLNEVQWLGQALEKLFAFRNRLISAHGGQGTRFDDMVALLERAKDHLTKVKDATHKAGLEHAELQRKLEKARREYEWLEGKLAEAQGDHGALEGTLSTKRGRLADERAKPPNQRNPQRIHDLQDEIGHLEHQLDLNREHRESLRGHMGGNVKHREALRDQMTKWDRRRHTGEKAEGVLSNRLMPAIETQRDDLSSSRDTLLTDLAGVQGSGPMELLTSLPAEGVLGGRIFDVQMRLRDLNQPPEIITDSPLADAGDSELAGLLQDQLKFANQTIALMRAQMPVLNDPSLSTYAGPFAKGGSIPAGMWGIAGERGPEPVFGPATVVSNRDGQGVLAGGQPPVNISVAIFEGEDRARVSVNDRDFEVAIERVNRRAATNRKFSGYAGQL